MEKLNVQELYDLIKKYYDYKVKMRYYNTQTKSVYCILYDSFLLSCSLDNNHDTFGAGIQCGGNEAIITEFLGKQCSLNNDEESIKKSLQIIDDYCRLRLPDKFLDAYYKAYVSDLYEDEEKLKWWKRK